MRREGSDENNLAPTDFLCDFCSQTWADDRPMIEGHRGSLVCGKCLALAFDELWNRLAGEDLPPESGPNLTGPTCAMCLERRNEKHWRSPVTDARLCKRCAKQSVVMLERDPDTGFKRPAPA